MDEGTHLRDREAMDGGISGFWKINGKRANGRNAVNNEMTQ